MIFAIKPRENIFMPFLSNAWNTVNSVAEMTEI
jgi:hypothetical protein